jgi:hypothetical protein
MNRRLAAPVILVAAAFALTGCVILPPVGGGGLAPEPIPGETLIPTDPDACDGGALRIDQPGQYRIGDCDELEIEGQDVEVIAGELGTVTIRGDRIELAAASIGSLDIGGQENEVDAASISSVQIAGDRNDVDSSGDIGAVTIGGNDNEVNYAGQVGTVDNRGDRNEVRQDR